MGWVDTLKGQVVGLDTAPLIYYIETNPAYLSKVDPFFDALDRGEFAVVTSVITLLEVLVHPLKQGNTLLAQRYRDSLLNANNVTTYPLSPSIAEEAARLRATYNLRTPDAVQIATAVLAGAASFLTNDVRLLTVPSLNVLVLDQLL